MVGDADVWCGAVTAAVVVTVANVGGEVVEGVDVVGTVGTVGAVGAGVLVGNGVVEPVGFVVGAMVKGEGAALQSAVDPMHRNDEALDVSMRTVSHLLYPLQSI